MTTYFMTSTHRNALTAQNSINAIRAKTFLSNAEHATAEISKAIGVGMTTVYD